MAMPQPGQVVNGYAYQGGDPNSQTSWKMLTGQDYLKTLNPNDQTMVQSVAQGRQAPPSGFQLAKSPYWQGVLQGVAQYEPGFDLTAWGRRFATAKDFASGKGAQNLTSFNTAIQHLDKLQQAGIALNNHDFTPLNAIGNYIEPIDGDPRVNNFNVAKNAVVDELTRAFRGTGGNESDIQNWAKSLDPNMSPAQLQGAISQATGLLKGRIDSLNDQYKRGMGTNAPDVTSFLSPGAQAVYSRMSQIGQIQPTPEAIKALQANPSLRDQFEQKYGIGSASQVPSQ